MLESREISNECFKSDSMTCRVSERKLSMQYEMALLFIGVTVIHDEKRGKALEFELKKSIIQIVPIF